jgi:hypothetical protein
LVEAWEGKSPYFFKSLLSNDESTCEIDVNQRGPQPWNTETKEAVTGQQLFKTQQTEKI